MTLHTFPDLEQGSDEWLEQRRGIVTASIVGAMITTRKLTAADYDCPECNALAGDPCVGKRAPAAPIKSLHPERAAVAKRSPSSVVIEPARNDTSRDIALLLAAERITGWTDPTYINDDMLRGIEDEPKARDKYSEHYAPVAEIGFMVRDDWGFKIGYSPDGLVGNDGLIEVKSRRPKSHLKTILAARPPIETMAQLQCGLLVSGRAWIDYVSYSGGMPMYVVRVYPDDRWRFAIVAAVRAFEANVTEILRLYSESVDGLPATERTIEQEMTL